MTLQLLFFGIFSIISAYFWIKWRYSFWTNRKVKQMEPTFPFGNCKQSFMGKIENRISFDVIFKEFYLDLKRQGERYGGAYVLLRPVWIPVDIQLISNIFQKDFKHFVDHAMMFHQESEPLTEHIFNLEGEKWRKIRSKLTLYFTSAKMKYLFDTVEYMGTILEEKISSGPKMAVDIKEIIACYATDVIANWAFGLETKCMDNPNVDFRLYGKKITEPTLLKHFMEFAIPWNILKLVGYKAHPKDVRTYFINLIENILQQRAEAMETKKDFVQLLVELENKDIHFTRNDTMANMFAFYLAGFETSSSATAFLVYELAKNQEIQDNLRKEIRSVLAKHDGKLTYDVLEEMKLATQCIEESLRMYPPGGTLSRRCTQTYKVPDSDLIINKGDTVFISVPGIHRDPEYYESPDKFNPNHFSDENKIKRPSCAFVPFGEGPRMCIGRRFGIMLTKVALTFLIRNHRFTLNKQTSTNVKLRPNQLTLMANDDLLLDVTKVD